MNLSIYLWPLVRGSTVSLLILLALAAGAYGLVFDHAGRLHDEPDGARLLLIGTVGETHAAGTDGGRSAYSVTDPTGSVWCITANGPPARGALIVVYGSRGSTSTGREICHEVRRAGTF